jgi:nucleotide-binding universal stress UspA family protein
LEEARHHDLVVMTNYDEISSSLIRQVLMQSGRPLLLAPARPLPAIGRTIAIAWKEGAEAARAVTAASSWLARAERVFVLGVSRNGGDDDRGRSSAERLVRSLAWGGIKAEARMGYATGPEAQVLQDMAYGCEADLLVMGAYGHSRLREYVLGGVTESVLAGCAIPVLMFR